MYLVRVPIFCLVLAVLVTACQRDHAPAPAAAPPVAGGVTALDSNFRVIGHDGRCNVLVENGYSYYSVQSESFEAPMRSSIQDLKQAQAQGDSDERIINLAHKVRRNYVRLITKWYKPFLDFTGGPFRCRVSGRQVEEMSSDDLYRNVPSYVAFVESIEGIPQKVRPEGTWARLWERVKEMGSR